MTSLPIPPKIKDNNKPLPFIYQFLAGGIAGTSEILAMYPLDVVKTRFQLQVGKTSASSSIFGTLKNMVKTEGFGSLYRGILPPIMVEAPKRAIKFAANEEYKVIYKDLFKTKNFDLKLAALTGVSAGFTEAFVVVPFDLVKIRLQDPSSSSRYTGTMDCIKKILKNEGPFAFFNGLEATIFRHSIWTGTYFTTIHYLKENFNVNTSNLGSNFLVGSFAGTLGTLLNTPFDVVKSRIQNQIPDPLKTKKYNWTIPSTMLVLREEGAAALFKGFAPKVLRLGPGGGILLVVFDVVSKFIRQNVDF